jgi:hypothetical protein
MRDYKPNDFSLVSNTNMALSPSSASIQQFVRGDLPNDFSFVLNTDMDGSSSGPRTWRLQQLVSHDIKSIFNYAI